MVPNSLGPAELLLRYGTENQKQFYLPRLARGEEVPCFALTSPTAGSDAASLTDSGVVCRGDFEGKKDILGIRLTWEKRYITLAPVATVLGLAFKLYDPDHLLGEKEEIGITLALIPTKTPGVTIGRRHSPLAISFMNGPTSGQDVFIPLEWIIGGVEWAGQGWRMLMDCLASGRAISLPALGTGTGMLASRSVGAYASIRRQFKTPIGQFEGVEEALARIGGYTYLMDAARVMTAGAVDQGEKPSVISAVVKYHLTETMRWVLNDAMDVLGGRGIALGPRNFLGRLYHAIPISITVEGANILTRSLIIFGQGAIRCHPWVLKEIKALSDPDPQRGSKNFDRALFGHAGFFIGNGFRSFWHAITGARLVQAPENHPSKRFYQNFSRLSASFALIADTAMMIMGGTLKRKERLSARLGDILSYLYLGSACLKRFEDQGRPKEDIPFLEWGCETCLHRIQQRLDQLIRSFPNRPVAWLLRILIFPFGKPFKSPNDRQVQRVARLLLKPSPARDRLTSGIFVSTDPTDPTGRLEVALMKMMEAESSEKKLKSAVRTGKIKGAYDSSLMEKAVQQGVITKEEADLINTAEDARRDVIMVDDFPKEYWGKPNP
jgi:acyl-CoA dehydrogenase